MTDLKTSSSSVTIVIASGDVFTDCVQAIYDNELFKQGNKFIFSDTFVPQVIIDEQTLQFRYRTLSPQLADALNGILFLQSHYTTWEKTKYLFDHMNETYSFTPIYRFAFDAILAVGYAFKEAQSTAPLKLFAALQQVDFLGATGRMKFNSQNDRLFTVFNIENVVNDHIVTIAKWKTFKGIEFFSKQLLLTGNVTEEIQPITFQGGEERRWSQWKDTPTRRMNHCMISDSILNQITIFGGRDQEFYMNDMWVYDMSTYSLKSSVFFFSLQIFSFVLTESEQWTELVTINPPTPRTHATCFILNNQFHLVGGYDGTNILNDMWILPLGNDVWKNYALNFYITGATVNTYKNAAYLFGGFDKTSISSKVYKYQANSLSWSLIDSVTFSTLTAVNEIARAYHCSAMIDKYLVVFGGLVNSTDLIVNGFKTSLNSLFMFDTETNTWYKRIQTNPPNARYLMQCGAIDNQLFIVGGWADNNDHSFRDVSVASK